MISCTLSAALLMAASALAQPPVTTIQDVLFKADGTRFDGSVTITWSSFEASDHSVIPVQSLTVQVVGGILRVQLVPTTTGNPSVYYSVHYNSDGRFQFDETWAVPPSNLTLRVRDVRIPNPNGLTVADTAGTTPVQESDVVGLIADLGARPLKGPAFSAGRVAYVNPLGALDAVSGSPTDCVRVDGSSGPCGDTQPSFVDADALTGIVDGSNATFGLSGVPDPVSSLSIYRNGLLMALGQDYTLTSTTVHFVAGAVPQPGDSLLASYRLTSTDSETPQLFPTAQVLCGGTGAATNLATFGTLGQCIVPAGVLAAGDRVQISYDLYHQGVASGFTFEVHWGATTVVTRTAAAADTQIAGHADVGLHTTGALWNAQSWGTVLPLNASLGTAADSFTGGLTVTFLAKLAQAGEVVTLRNFSVVRLP